MSDKNTDKIPTVTTGQSDHLSTGTLTVSGSVGFDIREGLTINVLDSEGLTLPHRAHEDDAGYDVFAFGDPIVKGIPFRGKLGEYLVDEVSRWQRIDYIQYGTGLRVEPTSEFSLELRPRSSNRNMNLVLKNSVGTVDRGYRGEILACFGYIFQPEDLEILNSMVVGKINKDKIYKDGDKICQMLANLDHTLFFNPVSEFTSPSKRGEGGHGSTGR